MVSFGETFNFYNEKCGKSFGNYNNDIMNILSNLVGVGSGTVAINTLYDVNLETVLPAPGTPISTQITAMKTKYKNLIF
jgi:hypothetical protein